MGTEYQSEKDHLCCPYCDGKIAEGASSYCQACQVTIFYCPKCQKPLPRDNRVCPHCGAEIKDQG
ncbi:zinc ribbon domain-containing protein [Chloroflexota bacterium]